MSEIVTNLLFTGRRLTGGSGSTLVCCAAQCKVSFSPTSWVVDAVSRSSQRGCPAVLA